MTIKKIESVPCQRSFLIRKRRLQKKGYRAKYLGREEYFVGQGTREKGTAGLSLELQYDEAVKRLLANKRILAAIMKDCVEEYRDCTVEEIAEKYIEGAPQVGEAGVHLDETNRGCAAESGAGRAEGRIHGAATEDASRTEGTVRYDIRFFASVPGEEGRISLIINVEAQNRFRPGYPLIKRAIYYGGRMLSAQYGPVFTKSEYGKLKKVYSIWLCTHPPAAYQNTITQYSLREKHIIGRVREERKNYDLLSIVMVCLGKADGENYGGLLKFLEVLLSDSRPAGEKRKILSEEFGMEMSGDLESGVRDMCNLSQGILERGIEEGMERGIQQGIERGIRQGVERGLRQGLERGLRQGVEQGLQQGERNAKRRTARNLAEMGMAVEQIARAVQEPVGLVEEWLRF